MCVCAKRFKFKQNNLIWRIFLNKNIAVLKSVYKIFQMANKLFKMSKSLLSLKILNVLHKWVRFYCHGTDEVSIEVLTAVFDYIATKVTNGDCAWTTWKNMYDTFRSSSLENRIAAVED